MNRLSRVLLFASILLLVFFSLVDFVETCTLSSVFVSQQTYPCSYYATKKDFFMTFGGCDLGCADGIWPTMWSTTYTATCVTPDAKWKTTCSEGETCKLRWNWDCSGSFEGKWDSEEDECVQCSGRIQIRKYKCANTGGTATNTCEEACGAPSQCEEKPPNFSLPDSCGIYTLEVNRKCTSDCSYSSIEHTCNSDNCGASVICGGNIYYCVFTRGTGWYWSTTRPVHFCCRNEDCAAEENRLGTCDPITYRCKWDPCRENRDCVGGYCCESLVGSRTTPYGCVARGTIRNDRHLCAGI